MLSSLLWKMEEVKGEKRRQQALATGERGARRGFKKRIAFGDSLFYKEIGGPGSEKKIIKNSMQTIENLNMNSLLDNEVIKVKYGRI